MCLYRFDGVDFSQIQISVLGKAQSGITAPEFVSIKENGKTRYGFQKKDENPINQNDLECLLSRIGSLLNVPMAEVIRTYKEPDLKTTYSLISLCVAQREEEMFISFSAMQDELYEELSAGMMQSSSWIQEWSSICGRRDRNPSGIWEIYAASVEDCEASFRYPLEIARMWTTKHAVYLVDFERSIIRMILFDILTGQTDRGQSNYGLLVDRKSKHARLAPLFDNATLKKPGLDESLNGFNQLLIDRELFAECAYGFWKDQFAAVAGSFLSRGRDILKMLSECSSITPAVRCWFKTRIISSMRYLKRLVYGPAPGADKHRIPFIDEGDLRSVIHDVFSGRNMDPTRIELLGKIDYEPKFQVKTAECSYFVKFSVSNRFSPELQASLKRIKETIHLVSVPLFSVDIPILERQLNVYCWHDGIPLSQMIRSKPLDECYQIGIECGGLLRSIHSIEPIQTTGTYHVAENLSKSMRVLFWKPDLLVQRHLYIPQMHRWIELLTRPHTLSVVHMDYVPKNLMHTETGMVVIDWDSCEISHPWLDFFDKGLALYPERQAFNTGVIDGYFEGVIPADFWDYFKALTVFALVRTSAWVVNQRNPTYVNMVEQHVCDSYSEFKANIPSWYIRYSKAGKD